MVGSLINAAPRGRPLFDTEDLRLTLSNGHGTPQDEKVCDDDRVVVVLRGLLVYQVDRHRHAVASPAVGLFLRRGQRYSYRCARGACVWLCITGRIAGEIIATGPMTRPLDIRAYAGLRTLVARLSTPPVDRVEVERLVWRLLAESEDHVPTRASDQMAVDAIVHLVNRTYNRPVPLVNLTGSTHLSMSHACRAFRRAMQISIHGYRREVRLRHALAMLIDTDAPLVTVALDNGFSNQGHLGNVFRRRFDMTPGEVRRAPSQALERLLEDRVGVDAASPNRIRRIRDHARG